MLQKLTKSLFMNRYQYKIVLVSPIAGCFREKDLDSVLSKIKSQKEAFKQGRLPRLRHRNPSSEDDFVYGLALQKLFKKCPDYTLRIETPFISFYTNNKKEVDAIIKLNESCVKYVCSPPESQELRPGVLVLPKVPYDYRVTLGKTTERHDAFLAWADNTNNKIKVTKSCRRMLERDRSWGGTYFYVKGENMLLMAKMHLGGSISKVEQVIQANN